MHNNTINTTGRKAKTIKMNNEIEENIKPDNDDKNEVRDEFWGKPITYKKIERRKKNGNEPSFADEKEFEEDIKNSIVQQEAEKHLTTSQDDDEEFNIDLNALIKAYFILFKFCC